MLLKASIKKCTCSSDNAINFLIIGIHSVPGKLVLEAWISLKLLFVYNAFDRDLERDCSQGFWDSLRGQLDHDG